MDYEDIENRKFVKKFKPEELILSNIENLVLHNVFIEDEIFIDNVKTDSIEFDTMITLGAKEYHINQAILKQIYTSIRFFVEVVATDTQFDLNKILTNLEGRIENIDKIIDGLDEPYIFPEITIKTSEIKFLPIGYDEESKKIDITVYLKNYSIHCDTKTWE